MTKTEAEAFVVKDQRENSGLDEFETATDSEILDHVRNVIRHDDVVEYRNGDGSLDDSTVAYRIVTAEAA